MRHFFTPLYIIVLSILFSPNLAFGQSSQPILTEAFDHVPLTQVLNTLEGHYGLKISYEHIAVENFFISQTFKGLPLAMAMDRILQETNLEYQIHEQDQILIRRKPVQENSPGTRFISGRITDGYTGEPLPYVTVIFGPNQGTEASEDGFFAFSYAHNQIPESITFRYLGYQPKMIPVGRVIQSEDLAVQLVPHTQEIKPVTITERQPLFSQTDKISGATTFRMSKLNTLPAFVGGKDPIRTLQYLPGISAHDDLSSGLKVRGSSGDENRFMLDGISLLNVSHYFGIFSAINPGIVDEVKVYKNVFPIEYGGKTASVVDISSHPFESGLFSGSAEVNLLTSNAHVELPLGKKAGLLIGGRITNKNIANTSLFAPLDQDTRTANFSNPNRENNGLEDDIVGLNPNFRFYDFNAKFTWQLGDKTRLSSSYFHGYDEFNYELFDERRRLLREPDTIRFDENANWRNQGLSVQLDQDWSSTFRTNLTFSQSWYESKNQITSEFTHFLPNQDLYRTVTLVNKNQQEVGNREIRIKNDWLLRPDQLFTFGLEFTEYETFSKYTAEDREVLRIDQTGQQYAFFANYRATIARSLELSLGLRPTYFSLTEKMYWSPRISMGLPLGAQWRLKGSWSRYYQFLRELTHENRLGRSFETWILPNQNGIPVASSRQVMAGFTWANNLFELDVELYHKKMDGVLEHALVINGFDQNQGGPSNSLDYRIFRGSGQSKGIDLLFKKNGRQLHGLAGLYPQQNDSAISSDR